MRFWIAKRNGVPVREQLVRQAVHGVLSAECWKHAGAADYSCGGGTRTSLAGSVFRLCLRQHGGGPFAGHEWG